MRGAERSRALGRAPQSSELRFVLYDNTRTHTLDHGFSPWRASCEVAHVDMCHCKATPLVQYCTSVGFHTVVWKKIDVDKRKQVCRYFPSKKY